MIEIHLDGNKKAVTKLQAARELAKVGGKSACIGVPGKDGWIKDYVSVYGHRRAFDTIQQPTLDCHHFIADTPAEMRQQAKAIRLAAEVCEWAEMIAAEQGTPEPEPVTWECTYCWTKFEAVPSDKPPACPECGPLHGPGASAAQPRRVFEPASRFDAGEGTRELSGQGRELLAAAIADAEAEPASVSLVGTIVVEACDDSPCPVTGKVVGQIDEETVEVLWGDLKFFPNPGQGSYEPIDALRPARQQAGA